MKRFLICFSLVVGLGASASFALGEENCSDAQSWLQRTEQEVWGQNLVRWLVNGSVIWNSFDIDHSVGDVTILEETRRLLKKTDDLTLSTVDALVRLPNKEPIRKTLICESWSNDRLD